MAGITETEPYFLIDMTNPRTVVWAKDCLNWGIYIIQCYYVPTTAPIGEFTETYFSGYSASGQIYLDEICFNSRCMTTPIYVANQTYGNSD
jgi:hypothetical protein